MEEERESMKLSQAIALGSTICTAGQYRRHDSDTSRTVGCGLEMALEAVGSHKHWGDAVNYWPWLRTSDSTGGYEWLITVAGEFGERVLNKGQSLESFIDWVASIEPPETCSECRSEQPVNEIQVCQECLSNK